MYKLLPILLFVSNLSFASEYDDKIQARINFRVEDINRDINSILDKNKYFIEVEYVVLDTINVDEIITRNNKRILEDKILAEKSTIRTNRGLLIGVEETNIFIVVEFICNPFISKLLEKDEELRNYERTLGQLIESNDWCEYNIDDISFTFIDIVPVGKNVKSIRKSAILSRHDIYDDSWAVIIGIDKYKYSDQLNYAVNDAAAVKDMLIDKFDYPEENIRYLTDEEATLSDIKLALDDISASADANDRILVFYSGHGETEQNNDGTETGYIIPVEGRQDKPYATGLAMDDILRICQMSNAKHMLFLMDACYSGLMTENVKGFSKPQDEGYLSKVANEKARQIITAGGGGEKVIERDEWQHSAFTKNLLAGLDDWDADTDEDGYITADELGTYLRKSVTEDSDLQQTPQKGRFKNSGDGEFLFFGEINTSNKLEESQLDKLIKKIGEDRVRQLLMDELSSLKCEPHCDKAIVEEWEKVK